MLVDPVRLVELLERPQRLTELVVRSGQLDADRVLRRVERQTRVQVEGGPVGGKGVLEPAEPLADISNPVVGLSRLRL